MKLDLARQLSGKQVAPASGDRFSRSTENELARVKALEGFTLFSEGTKDSLPESDFYNYFAVTVRTQKNAFIGRLESVNTAIDELRRHDKDALCARVIEYHEFLISKHKDIIDFFTAKN